MRGTQPAEITNSFARYTSFAMLVMLEPEGMMNKIERADKAIGLPRVLPRVCSYPQSLFASSTSTKLVETATEEHQVRQTV